MSFLLDLLSTPAVPFREQLVRNILSQELQNRNIPYIQDPFGNILAGLKSENEYRDWLKNPKQKLLGIAHMDHPGFFGSSWSGSTCTDKCTVKWHGGGPSKNLVGASVWISNAAGKTSTAIVEKVQMTADGKFPDILELQVADTAFAGAEIWGGFPGKIQAENRDGIIHTKSADDLGGCFVLLENLARENHSNASSNGPTLAVLFSRAEEVGFIGCIAHVQHYFRDQNSKENLTVLSIETSKAMPGAEFGKGVVVRQGDRMTMFDSARTLLVKEIAKKELPDQHQSRVMDGGACEASACVALGLRAVAMSIPLGNYHNTTENNEPAAEFIYEFDLNSALKLTESIVRFVEEKPETWKSPELQLGQSMVDRLTRYQDLLLEKNA